MKDPKFEFIKGVSITFVILLHTIDVTFLKRIGFFFHVGQAVPLFLLTTFVLSYMSLGSKRGKIFSYWYSWTRFISLIKRIIVPFFVTQIVMWCILYLQNITNPPQFAIRGWGPGAYYMWIYLQFWLLIPFFYYICSRFNLIIVGGAFLSFNVVLQATSCFFGISEENYQLLFFRYLFLAYLGFLFLKVKFNFSEYFLCTIIGGAYYFSLNYVNYVPFFYNSWMNQQLPAFFYTLVLFKLLIILYSRFGDCHIIHFFVKIGNYSWTIFMLQMFFVKVSIGYYLDLKTGLSMSCLYFAFIYLLCISPVLVYDYKWKGAKTDF